MNNETVNHYKSLAEIRARKEFLRSEIQQDDEKIQELWNSLFAKHEENLPMTPSKRLSSLFNLGGGILDAVLLGWKLYRKFNNRKGFSKRKR